MRAAIHLALGIDAAALRPAYFARASAARPSRRRGLPPSKERRLRRKTLFGFPLFRRGGETQAAGERRPHSQEYSCMRLVTFSDAQGTRIGVHDAASEYDRRLDGRQPPAEGHDAVRRARQERLAARAPHGEVGRAPHPHRRREDSCAFPASREEHPGVGKNYHDHAREFHASGFDASAARKRSPTCRSCSPSGRTRSSAPGSRSRARTTTRIPPTTKAS